MEFSAKIALAGAPTSASLTINLPTGYTIDTAKLPQTTGGTGSLGYGTALDSGVAAYPLYIDYSTTTAVAVYVAGTAAAYGTNSNVTQAVPITFGASDAVDVYAKVPIVGWSSNSVQSSDTDTRVVAAVYELTSSTANSSFADNAVEIVDYDTKIFDTHNAVTTGASWKFTAPVSGYYRVSAPLNWANGTNLVSAVVLLYKNGVQYGYLSRVFGTDLVVSSASPIVQLNAGEYIDVRALQDDSASAARSLETTSSRYQVCIERVTGPAVIAATESVNGRYYGATATVTGTDSTVTYSTKDFDSHNAYASGTLTIPVSGKYQFNAATLIAATYAATNNSQVAIYKNGTGISINRVIAYGTAGTLNCLVSDVVSCLAGDLITFRTSSNGTTPTISASNFSNYVSWSRVGN